MPLPRVLARVLGIVALSCLVLLAMSWLAIFLPVPLIPPTWGGIGVVAAGSVALGVGALIGRACAVTLERGRLRPLMVAGIVLVPVALLAWALCAWLGLAMRREQASQVTAIVAIWLSGIAVLIAVIAFVYRARVSGALERVAAGALVFLAAAIVGLCLVLSTLAVLGSVFAEFDTVVLFRSIFLALLAAMVLAAATLAATRLRTRFGSAKSSDASDLVRLTCPRCGSAQSIAMGGSRCAACGLRIIVESA